MQLRCELTTLWFPFGGGFDLGEPIPIPQFNSLEVTIELNGQRTASLEVSVFDYPIYTMTPYDYCLRVWMKPDYEADDEFLVFWGQIPNVDIDVTAATCTFHAVDPSLRLMAHFIRLGDMALNKPDHAYFPNPYDRAVPVNGEGIRMCIDAAQNIGWDGIDPLGLNQAGRYPPLGIYYGTDTSETIAFDSNLVVKFTRGQQVWDAIQEIVSHEPGPEFELAPSTLNEGCYVELNTFDRAGLVSPTTGHSYDTPVTFQQGWIDYELGEGDPVGTLQADNAKITHSAGGKLVTHAHVLSSEDAGIAKRVTTANPGTLSTGGAARYGVFVEWDQTQYGAKNTDLLSLRGQYILAAYGRPNDICTVAPNPDCEFQYLRDYMVGTTVNVRYQRGGVSIEDPNYAWAEMEARITGVTLRQGASILGETELTTVPHVTESTIDEDS